MKKFTMLMIAMLLMTMGASAKTTETTLWEDTYTSAGVEIGTSAVSTFEAGNVLRVYVTVPEGGANFKICYKGESNKWAETTIPSIDSQWPWVNGGDTYYDVTFTDADITALIGMNIYVYKGDNSTISKVSLLVETADEDVTEESLWTGSISTGDWGYTAGTDMLALSYDDKGSLASAMMTDMIKVTYTVTASGAQVYVQNPNGWTSLDGQDDDSYDAEATNTGKTFTMTISDAATLEAIQQNGILIRGKNIIITTVDLLKPAGRYDAVPLTIGEDGVATFGSSKSLDFSGISGVTPYYVSACTTGSVTLTAVSTTRAWAGYIVQGTSGTYSIPVAASQPDWIDAFNNLHYAGDYDGNWVYRSAYAEYSGDDDKIKTYYRYIFANDETEGVGFYRLATDYTNSEGKPYHILNAHKAYLETATDITPVNTARIALRLDGDITGINQIENGEFNIVISQPVKRIVNGKLVIEKNGRKFNANGQIVK